MNSIARARGKEFPSIFPLPETSIASENGWLKD